MRGGEHSFIISLVWILFISFSTSLIVLSTSFLLPRIANDKNVLLTENRTGRASPSTREAIAGMLSMSRVIPGGRSSTRKLATTSFSNVGGTRYPRTKRKYTEDESISKVHQDEDYG